MGTFPPDDILFDILIRLPAGDIFRYRLVCKKWKELTSTKAFVERHLQHAKCIDSITFLVRESGQKLLLIDKNGITVQLPEARPSPEKRYFPLLLSCDGLVLIQNDATTTRTDYIVRNLTTQEEVRIRAPNLALRDERIVAVRAYGMFLHPLLNEYCILWGLYYFDKSVSDKKFWMLNLGPQPNWREMKCEGKEDMNICWDISSRDRTDVVVDGIVYWMLELTKKYGDAPKEILMAFDIVKEEVFVMAHPASEGVNVGLNVVNMGGFLGLVQCLSPPNFTGKTNVTIWILEDYWNKVWRKSHTIDMDFVYGYGCGVNVYAISFLNEELYLRYLGSALYALNLKTGTLRKIMRKLSVAGRVLSYTPSLISLKECQSFISM
ncbi:hypothetical protein M9H77_28781 [Catharanthus roseus]|uniref:Uncharacterized protein n=1 Tax=Catharanthus roseus TaxID=4058 RepID=A0ACC0AJ11_CATRO|nr:hypothetical protein M9H77_28781 [Catharanthus roseus]